MVHFCHYGSPLFLLLLSALPLPLRGSKEMSQFIFPCLNSRFREPADLSLLLTKKIGMVFVSYLFSGLLLMMVVLSLSS